MGDFSANFKRPESGIYTAEGNVAGSRAAMLTKKRETEQKLMEEKTLQIRSDAARSKKNIHSKFSNMSNESEADQAFRARTIGLVSAKDFKEAQMLFNGDGIESIAAIDKKREEEMRIKDEEERKASKARSKKEKKRRKKMLSTLSFANEDEEEGEIQVNLIKKSKKNPDVDTSFLPDKQREEDMELEKERLKTEWIITQEQIKKEKLQITYSYWDGSGHRRQTVITKGASVGEFLEKVRKDLSSEFREMQNATADALIYVKEDLIIPSDITFYDLIVTKARGKSGPLFHFDVHDDVRIGPLDSRVEKDESHPGKVVERRWYDRNKHIFPASRWEIYDPSNEHAKYTIHGD